MCGICGWFHRSGRPPDSEVLLPKMVQRLHHRGPDEQGHFTDGPVGLGIARLSINDVAGGHQPYRNEDGTVVAVFNGEIYNFAELRADLVQRGHEFRSRTDGEVIVHLYEEYGPAFVDRLNGMFAIALWDQNDLYLYRDRLGLKPLYVAEISGTVYFASELKSLLEVSAFDRRLNHSALRSYLTLEYVPGPHSIYQQVQKLAPGHWAKINSREFLKNRYWSLPGFVDQGGSMEEWVERLRGLLSDAVRLRLVADVPLGAFLSGGLDSSTLTSLMCQLHSEPVHTFSIGFSEASFDESRFSDAVSRKLGTVHHHRRLDAQASLDVLQPLYANLDEPMADPALIPTYLLSKFAKENVTVALSGEGADEILGGYPTYLAHQIAQGLDVFPSGMWRAIERWVGHIRSSRDYLSWDFKLKKFVSGLGHPDLIRHLTWMGSLGWESSAEILIDPSPQALDLKNLSFSRKVVERAQMLDVQTYLVDDLLVKLDRATMMVSLEGRAPYLDHRLVEAMAGLPTRHKLRGLDAKRVLKRVEGPRLPAEVVRRQKKGFGVPLADWLCGPLKSLMDEHLCESHLKSQGLFRVQPVRRLVSEHLSGVADHRKPLWTLLVFQQWFANYRPVL